MGCIRKVLERGQVALPAAGRLQRKDLPLVPWTVIGADGREVAPIASFLSDLWLSDASPLTLRSYGYDLLRWWRLLDVVDVAWDRATRSEVELLVGWMRTSPNPQRHNANSGAAAARINPRTGRAALQPGYSARTINHALTVISGFYAFHAAFGLGPVVNPVPVGGRTRFILRGTDDQLVAVARRAPLRQRQQDRRPRHIPDSQWDELFATMGCHRDSALLAFYASSGARANELLGLTADRIDRAAQQVWVVSKGSRLLEAVPGSPDAFMHLALYFDETGTPPSGQAVWRTRLGVSRPLTYWAMRRVLQRANDRLGTNWTLHDLRHTLASKLANDPGITITDVQTVLRHRQLSTTQRYVVTDVEQLHDKLQEHYLRPRPAQTFTPGYSAEDVSTVFDDYRANVQTRPRHRDQTVVDRRYRFGRQQVITPARGEPSAPAPQPYGPLRACDPARLREVITRVYAAAPSTLSARRRAVATVLEHLVGFDGEDWQQRWLASGLDEPGRPVRALGIPRAGRDLTTGFATLCALRVIAPSLPAFRSNIMIGYPQLFRAVEQDDTLDAFFAAVASTPVGQTHRRHGLFDVCCALTTQQISLTDLTPAALLHYAQSTREAGYASYAHTTHVGHTAWRVLHEMGHFPATVPTSLRAALRPPQLSPAELVAQHAIANNGVRDLLTRYLTRRSHTIDYVSLRGVARTLCGTFWNAIEKINPAQPDLRLSEAHYQAWRHQLNTRADGKPRTAPDGVLIPVRALYADIQAWATESADWAAWAAPCPIPAREMRTRGQRQRRTRERTADRTRVLQPLLPLLVAHVQQHHDQLTALLASATRLAGDTDFEVDGCRYRRLYTAADEQHRRAHGYPNIRVHDYANGKARDLTREEDTAFWRWAVVEGLRHTGVRIEELLELSQLSVRQYRRANGEVIALLVIAPSKSDRERVIPMSAELFHLIAIITRRHTRDQPTVPLAICYDPHERLTSDPQPLLYQRVVGQRREAIAASSVTMRLRRLCTEMAHHNPGFRDAHVSPQDFRRIFATKLVNSGLPIHIGAVLLGHLDIQTTRGYVPVFDEDVVRHYQAHLACRRALRPAQEYRPATEEEWAEFDGHFDKRKVELGTCGRPYGTACAHEHACVRCPMLRIDSGMLIRLNELELDLRARRVRAEAEGWLGELEGIDLSLSFLADKRSVARRVASGTVALGMPQAPSPACWPKTQRTPEVSRVVLALSSVSGILGGHPEDVVETGDGQDFDAAGDPPRNARRLSVLFAIVRGWTSAPS